MQNDAGEFVDLYVPRKCSASNRIIGAKDHASIQINISEVDKVTGRVNGQFKTYAICGAIRRMGESDDSILRLAKNDGIVSKYVCLSYPLTLGAGSSKTAKDSMPASGKMVCSSSLEVHWEQSQETNVLQQERSSPVRSSVQHGHIEPKPSGCLVTPAQPVCVAGAPRTHYTSAAGMGHSTSWTWGMSDVNGHSLHPPYFNLAEGTRISATATCGEEAVGAGSRRAVEDLYCKLVGGPVAGGDPNQTIQGQYCDICSSANSNKAHPITNAIDGTERWWQSPPLSRGLEFNQVNVTLDLGQVTQVLLGCVVDCAGKDLPLCF
ncbi:laminin subunit alpha-5 [Limosa lapponica baueri]|uniref:Small ribosomal subunit protein eS21 n=1 Tax=Limosa lapponica baueri TaxID=1758121 RepID=A0A2I0TNF4_LIMLA|nr:laminin subunit alpha-5 [Limosa lapponica baueri]